MRETAEKTHRIEEREAHKVAKATLEAKWRVIVGAHEEAVKGWNIKCERLWAKM